MAVPLAPARLAAAARTVRDWSFAVSTVLLAVTAALHVVGASSIVLVLPLVAAAAAAGYGYWGPRRLHAAVASGGSSACVRADRVGPLWVRVSVEGDGDGDGGGRAGWLCWGRATFTARIATIYGESAGGVFIDDGVRLLVALGAPARGSARRQARLRRPAYDALTATDQTPSPHPGPGRTDRMAAFRQHTRR